MDPEKYAALLRQYEVAKHEAMMKLEAHTNRCTSCVLPNFYCGIAAPMLKVYMRSAVNLHKHLSNSYHLIGV